MGQKTGMSQVKFKVRHNALLLREFTAADMIRATGLNPESVRTELQRMKQEGLLLSRPYPGNPRKRGGPPVLYQLTDDPEARLALSEGIEAFYPPPPPAEKPTSRHYLLARQLLNRAQIAEGEKRKQLLAQAEQDLEVAEQAERGALAPRPVKAYLQYERARLAYLRGELEEAEKAFEDLHVFFVSAQDEAILRHIDEFRLFLKVQERFMAEFPGTVKEPIARATGLLDALAESANETDSPLLLLLQELLRKLYQAEAQAAAREMMDERARAQVLTGLAAHLPEALKPDALTEALAAEQGIATEDVGVSSRLTAGNLWWMPEEVNSRLSAGNVWWIPDEVSRFGSKKSRPWVIVGGYSAVHNEVIASPFQASMRSEAEGIIMEPGILPRLNRRSQIRLTVFRRFSAEGFRNFEYEGQLSAEWIRRIRSFYSRERRAVPATPSKK